MESYTFWEIIERCGSLLGGMSGIFLLFIGGAKLFGKNLLSHWFNKDLETHKASLAQTTNEMQERLRIEYGAIYKERLSAIKEIHKHTISLELIYDKLTGNAELTEAETTNVKNEFEGAITYLSKIKEYSIYFDKRIATNIYETIELLTMRIAIVIIEDYTDFDIKDKEGDINYYIQSIFSIKNNYSNKTTKLSEIYKVDFDSAIICVQNNLEEEFRRLIGITPYDNNL